MKKIIGIVLALTLALSIAAFAENTPAAPAIPAVTEEATATEEAAAEQTEDDNTALQDALDAYRKAKQDKRVSNLEEELSEYVEAGTLTQEQADLILNNVKERMAAKNGECPNCGYELRGQKKSMRGGQQRGSQQHSGQHRGGKMARMGGMNSQMNGMQRPDAQNGATPRQDGVQHGQQMPGMAQPQM